MAEEVEADEPHYTKDVKPIFYDPMKKNENRALKLKQNQLRMRKGNSLPYLDKVKAQK